MTDTQQTNVFFRNNLTGMFFRNGAWNETNPHNAQHFDHQQASFVRVAWCMDHVTEFPSEPEREERPMGRFFQSVVRGN